jgi:acyl dehydratase
MSRRSLDAVMVGEELPALARVVTAADVKAYADAGGDQNPLHQDDRAARAAGFPGIIAHGMFTMGHMAAAVAAWAGDPAAVVAISAQFRAPVFMGERIEAGGRVRHVDPGNRTAVLETWVSVERDGETLWPVKKGEATVLLA